MQEHSDIGDGSRGGWRYHLATLLMVAVALGVGAVLRTVGHRSDRTQPAHTAPEPAEALPQLASFCGRDLGAASATVQVLAMLPVSAGCQDEAGLYLLDVVKKHGDRLGVRILDIKSDEAQCLMRQHRVKCACVLINGRTRFDLGGETGKVLLEGPMDVSDIRLALQAELHAAYGDSVGELPPAPEPVLPSATRMPAAQGN